MIAGARRKKEHIERVLKRRPKFDPLLSHWRIQIFAHVVCTSLTLVGGDATVVSPAPLKDR
jgi:hypothetical protein